MANNLTFAIPSYAPQTLEWTVTVPAGATPGATFARFRLSGTSGLGATETASNGEVEDCAVSILPLDFGDAPASYPVTRTQNGARHQPGGPCLGGAPDTETDGTSSAHADADDLSGSDDENGITFPVVPASAGQTGEVRVVVSGEAGFVDAWIDFNADGDWNDAGEQIAAAAAVSAGTNTLHWTSGTPLLRTTNTFARFRISRTGGLPLTGLCPDGEVEDHRLTLPDRDTDRDGMPDYWETLAGLDPLHATDATEDLDSDDLPNLEEWIAQTDPANYFSRLTAKISLGPTNGSYRLRFLSSAIRTYRIEACTDPANDLWEVLRQGIPGTGGYLEPLVELPDAGARLRVGVEIAAP